MLQVTIRRSAFILIFLLLFFGSQGLVADEINATAKQAQSDELAQQQVIQAFNSQEVKESEHIVIKDEKKRLIMFFLGVPLLILLMVTVVLGVAMGVYGKPLFLAHMVCAGLSMTLALAHAVVGIVWFYPF